MLTEKDYCDYETSVALYELGYDCQVIHLIAEKITLYEAQKWLREEKDIFIYPIVDKFLNEEGDTIWNCQIYIPYVLIKFTHPKNTFEDALLDGIKEAIKFIKENEET